MERLWGGEAGRFGLGNDLGGMREHRGLAYTAALSAALKQGYTTDDGQLNESTGGISGSTRRHEGALQRLGLDCGDELCVIHRAISSFLHE